VGVGGLGLGDFHQDRIGRLDGESLLSAWSDIIADMTATELPIDSPDAILAGRLPPSLSN